MMTDRIGRYVAQKYLLRKLTEENKLLGADIAEEVEDAYNSTGAKTFEASLPGIGKIGTLSARVSKRTAKLKISDREKLDRWLLNHGLAHEETRVEIVPDVYVDALLDEAAENGQVIPGTEFVRTGPGFEGITARPDRKVLDAALEQGLLGEAVRGLLGEVE